MGITFRMCLNLRCHSWCCSRC